MLADLFFIFAMLLFVLRIVFWERNGTQWVISDIFSALFMVLAFYFYVFSPIANSTLIMGAYSVNTVNAITGNVIQTLMYPNVTQTTSTMTPQIPVNSNSFILLSTATIFYAIIMFILALRDFIFRKGTASIRP